MRRQFHVFALLIVMCTARLFAQTGAHQTASPGLELLQQVAQQYADAKSYYIEATEERTSTTDYSRSWQKTVMIAAQSSGDRSHFEGHSSSGSAMKVADGKTVWTYRIDEHRYTAKPQSIEVANHPSIIGISEMTMFQAEQLKESLGMLAKSLRSAERLPDTSFVVNGQKIQCQVVRFKNTDQKRSSADAFDKTIWIDAAHHTVVKMIEHAETYLISGASRIALKEETSTVFTTVELNRPLTASMFTFTPPVDAKQVEDFPDPTRNLDASMMGDQAPHLKLKTADGKEIALDSFRGQPVLIDFWATWCGPCVAALPKLAQIYTEGKDKGLVLIGVDRDEEPNTATDFLVKKGYTWRDFHDGDGEIEKLVGSSGIPRVMLINASGKIVYDGLGSDEDTLRTEIAKLGPEYVALAPKPKQPPCVMSH